MVQNLIFEHINPNIKITKKELKLFESATSSTQILFREHYHNQINGVTMDSHLGLVLINLFMGFHGKFMKFIWVST